MTEIKTVQILIDKIFRNTKNIDVAEKPYLIYSILKSLRNGGKFSNLIDVFNNDEIRNEYFRMTRTSTPYDKLCKQIKRIYFNKDPSIENTLLSKLDKQDYDLLVNYIRTRLENNLIKQQF